MYICIYIYIYVYTHLESIHTCLYMYIYVYIYMYRHTCTSSDSDANIVACFRALAAELKLERHPQWLEGTFTLKACRAFQQDSVQSYVHVFVVRRVVVFCSGLCCVVCGESQV